MWASIIGVVTGPFFKLLLSGYIEKLKASGLHENKVVELASQQMMLDGQEARLNADRKRDILGHWYTPENLFAYFIAFPYWFVVITMDYLVFPALDIKHATLPLQGDTAVVMMMIMTFWLGKRAITTVASIIADAFGRRT